MKVLLAPLLARGGGTGHLRRCLDLASRLGGRAAFVTGLDADEPLAQFLGAWPRLAAGQAVDGPALVVADRFRTGRPAYRRLAAMGPVVGIDEGGRARHWMAALIDTPLMGGRQSPRGLLDLPPRSRSEPPQRIERVLVSFGGEDPADLSGPTVRLLLGLFAPGAITVVQGPRFSRSEWPAGVGVLVSPDRLAARLHEYDLVITAFGLTCFEALAAGVPVILVSPRSVHRRLARGVGLVEAGLGRPRRRTLAAALADPAALGRQVEAFHARPKGASLAETLAALAPSGCRCPACGNAGPDRVVARFDGRTYLRCSGCGLLYLLKLGGPAQEYGHSYFFDDYARQYGRTYLEDFESIRQAGEGRLAAIQRVVGPVAGLRLLDVGCAFGPFLAAARDLGADAQGVEPQAEAASYVRSSLGIPCWEGRFDAFAAPDASFEVLSMWYVIEHFVALEAALRRVNRLLVAGGLFAFATPNALGVSGRARPRAFLEASPPDHFTIWDPPRARRVLARVGFRLVRVRVTGHHPERFPFASGLAAASAGPFASAASQVLGAASRVLRLGDTFEAYAVKVRTLDG